MGRVRADSKTEVITTGGQHEASSRDGRAAHRRRRAGRQRHQLHIGATNVTNGCFRLHPNEWSTGESAGHLAAFCLDHGVRPRAVRAAPELVAGLQRRLERDGVELERPHWQPSMSCHRYRVYQPGLVLG